MKPSSRARLILLSIFLAERAVLYAAGIRCQLDGLSWYWQLLDLQLLKNRLLSSLLLLHAQPPLFNFFTGLLLKTGAGMWIFSLFCTLGGLLMCLFLFEILSEFGWAPKHSILLLSLLAILPAWILYEQWYFYDFPTALLLAASVLFLLRWGRSGKTHHLLLYLGSITGLAGIRSIFHIIWLIPAVAIAFFAGKPISRRLRAALAIPVLLVGGWYLKNELTFGFFGSSSWMGLSLAKMTTILLPSEDARRLVAEGRLSALSLVRRPFAPISEYESASGLKFADPPGEVLGARRKQDGQPNYNHFAYLRISSLCRKDAFEVIRSRPKIYLDAIRISLHCFFGPVSVYPAFRENLSVLAPIAKLEVYGWDSSPFSILIFTACIIGLFLSGFQALRRRDPAMAAVCAFALFTIFWVFITGSLLEIGENERFRFLLFPLLFLALAALPGLSERTQKSVLPGTQENPGSSVPPEAEESE